MKTLALATIVFTCACATQTLIPPKDTNTTLHTSWEEITPYMQDYLHIQQINDGKVDMITICEKNTEKINMTPRQKALDQTAYALLMADTKTFVPMLREHAQNTPKNSNLQQAQEHLYKILQDENFKEYICTAQQTLNDVTKTLQKEHLIAFNDEYNPDALRYTRMILLQQENKNFEKIKQEVKNYPIPNGAFYIDLCP